MIKGIIAIDTYVSQPCERCNSKKRYGKTWKESVPTFTGKTTVEYTQIICTNKVCQTAFDKFLIEETKKKELIKKKKDENNLVKKSNFILRANKNKKSSTKN